MASALTPLGQRTKAGFEKKFGKTVGDQKFEAAMSSGMIDRAKMENVGLVEPPEPGEGSPAEEAAESPADEAAEEVQEPAEPPPPRLPPVQAKKKGKVPVGLARGAPGMFQKRPG